MNVWLESLVVWLVDFACISTVLLLAALLMRLVIRDAVGRVRLLWGAWLTVIAAGAIAACPLWPRIAVADLLRTNAAPQQTPVVVEHSEVSPAIAAASSFL